MSTSVEHNFELAMCNGETRKWNFDKYSKVHMDRHQTLTDLEDHGYKWIDERSKVHKLLNGIKTDATDVVKAQIIAR